MKFRYCAHLLVTLVISAQAGVRVDSTGVILGDGSRFFPIGAYVVSWKITVDSLISNMRQIRDAGFNMAHIGFTGDEKRVMDSAQAFGLKIIAEGGNQDRAMRLKSHPALLAWTIQDEPELNNVSVAVVQQRNQSFKTWDPDHPTVVCLTDSTRYNQYAYMPDILAIDPYLNYFMRCPVSYVGDCTRKALSLRRELFVVIHAFVEGQRFPLPTVAQERSIVYQAIISGARGLNFFAFNCPPCGNWFLPADTTFYSGVKRLVSEMRVLGPVLAHASMRTQIPSPNSAITAAYLASNGKRYIIGVSSSDKPISGVRFSVEPNVTTATVVFENRKLQISGSVLTDNFEPYASHVYELNTPVTIHKTGGRTTVPARNPAASLFDARGRKLPTSYSGQRDCSVQLPLVVFPKRSRSLAQE